MPFTYQWYLVSAPDTAIPGATTSTLVLQPEHEGFDVYCVVGATNLIDTTYASSNTVGPVAPLGVIPANTVAPVVSGTLTEGDTLSCTTGSWTGDPYPTFSYQWIRDNGVSVIYIGTDSPNYTTVSADIGNNILCNVLATNFIGTTSKVSNTVGPIVSGDTIPVNTVPPSISGVVRIGNVLTRIAGTWTGSPTPSISGQWRRDGVGIIGEVAATYTVVAADMSAEIDYLETASNIAGSDFESSNILTSPWRAALLQGDDPLIFDGLDPYCYGGVSIGSPVTDIYTVNGILIGTQGVSGSRPTRGTASLVFDGIDDHVIANSHASKFNAASTAIFGFRDPNDLTTAARTLWSSGQTDSGATTRQLSVNYSRPGAINATRMRVLIADTALVSISLIPLASKGAGPYDLVFRFDAPGSSCQADDMTSPLTIIDAAVTRPNNEAVSYNWLTIGARGVGVSPTYSQYWEGKFTHFLIDTTKYTEPQVLVYRSCAIAAGVMV